MLIGLPTILLLPSTTHSLPSISIPDLLMSWITPAGVHDTKPGCPMLSAPTLIGWKPSTSLAGSISRTTAASSIWGGGGLCTSMPWTAGSTFNSRTIRSSSSWEASEGRTILREFIPSSAHFFTLEFTYTWEAGSSPTRTTAKPGVIPCSLSRAISLSTSSSTWEATCFPSMICIIMIG